MLRGLSHSPLGFTCSLPCGHTICRSCVSGVCAGKAAFVCPVDMRSFPLAGLTPQTFGSVNLQLRNMIEFLQKQRKAPVAVAAEGSSTGAIDCMHQEHRATGCKKAGCEFRHRVPDAEHGTLERAYCKRWVSRSVGDSTSAGKCEAGVGCPFAHPSSVVLCATDCPQFLNPANGLDSCDTRTCRLRHSTSVRESVACGSLRVCPDWLNGFCKHGIACTNVHPVGRTDKNKFAFGFSFLVAALALKVKAKPVAAIGGAGVGVGLGSPLPVGSRIFSAWDIENCPFEQGAAHTLIAALNGALQGAGVLAAMGENEVRAFYNPRLADPRYALKGGAASALAEAGVTLQDVGLKKGAADHALKEAVSRCLRDKANGLNVSAIVLITGDGDFTPELRAIKLAGVTSVLVAGNRANAALKSSADVVLHWSDITSKCTASTGVRAPLLGVTPPLASGSGLGVGVGTASVPLRSVSRKPCAFFASGNCRKGAACAFSHATVPIGGGSSVSVSTTTTTAIAAPGPASPPKGLGVTPLPLRTPAPPAHNSFDDALFVGGFDFYGAKPAPAPQYGAAPATASGDTVMTPQTAPQAVIAARETPSATASEPVAPVARALPPLLSSPQASAPAHEHGDEEEEEGDPWVCAACTFENAADLPHCELCEAVRALAVY